MPDDATQESGDQHGDQAEYCEMAEEYILGRTEDGKCPLCREDLSEQMEDLEERLEEQGVSIDV